MDPKEPVRSVHKHLDEPCPKVVYIYWDRRTGKLEAFPPRIQIGVGDGIRWVPFDLSSMQIDGELTVKFQRGESPFRESPTDEVKYEGPQPRSGAAIKAGTYPYTVKMDTQTIEVELTVAPIAAVLTTRCVSITRVSGQIVVDPMKISIWRHIDEIEWEMTDDFEIDFMGSTPFTKSKFRPKKDASDKHTQESHKPPKTYKYSVKHMASGQVLDPDVEVEDP